MNLKRRPTIKLNEVVDTNPDEDSEGTIMDKNLRKLNQRQATLKMSKKHLSDHESAVEMKHSSTLRSSEHMRRTPGERNERYMGHDQVTVETVPKMPTNPLAEEIRLVNLMTSKTFRGSPNN